MRMRDLSPSSSRCLGEDHASTSLRSARPPPLRSGSRTRSSSAMIEARSSRRAFAYSNLAPCSLSTSPTRPPIQPLLPKIRNTCWGRARRKGGGLPRYQTDRCPGPPYALGNPRGVWSSRRLRFTHRLRPASLQHLLVLLPRALPSACFIPRISPAPPPRGSRWSRSWLPLRSGQRNGGAAWKEQRVLQFCGTIGRRGVATGAGAE